MKNVFKIFFLLSFLCSLASFAREVKLIQITDINLTEQNAYKFEKTIEEINEFKDIDFVLLGGNNIANSNIDNLNTFTYLINKINKRCIVLLGSSDVYSSKGIDKEYYLKKVNRAKFHSKKPNYTFKKQGYLFVVMDGSKQYFKSSNGYYNKEELLWLDKTLEKNKNEKVIILQHFPILESTSKWLETAKIDEYKEILAKHNNIFAIISGHYDKNIETKNDGIYHIVTESYSKKGAYKIIELDKQYDFVATYLVRN
ncbi:MAG: metallophosphoesterase [Candidatus Gastranaerophilales bacterium]|nr:metallophosphoesterase [Candidatus Gastranaerophilales bacterium]